MEFYCHGFWTGTSGGPWILGYNAKNGTGTVFGVIGGYELGGDYEWASYSAYFGSATRSLYTEVEHESVKPTPTPTPTPTLTPTTPSPSPASTTFSATPAATWTTPFSSAAATSSLTPTVLRLLVRLPIS